MQEYILVINGRISGYSNCGHITETGENEIELSSLDNPQDFRIDNYVDYIVQDNQIVYDPLPIPEEPEPEETEETSLEDRVAALEENNDMLTECILEMSELVYA